MKVSNAIKKLKKNGFSVKRHEESKQISGWRGEHRVGFYDQDGKVVCIWTDCDYTRKTKDVITDYFPETYHRNIAQAISFVSRQLLVSV